MLPRIHLLYGNESLKLNETLKVIVDKFLEGQDPSLSFERFDVAEILKEGGGSAVERVEEFKLICETPPFLSDRKLIRLDNVDRLKGSVSKKKGENNTLGAQFAETVSNYLKNLPDYCSIIMTSSVTREQEINKNLLKIVQTQGKVLKFVVYEDNSPIAWILERSSQKGMALTSANAQLLIELVGNDLNDLNQELEKLSLLFPQASSLSNEALLQHVHGNKHATIFRITQALSQKNILPALETLDQVLMESSNTHILLFTLIAQQFKKLLKIHYLFQQNANENKILGTLGMPPFLGSRLVAQAKNFSLGELEAILLELARLDIPLKFHSQDARCLLQNLFQQICSGKFKAQHT
ncbi:DNA polymerase III subunit delta [Deltaproteobacteria bacterium TL4]